MELNIDFEPPEKRTLAWLSQLQTYSDSFKSLSQSYSEPSDVPRHTESEKDCESRLKECSESEKSKAYKHSFYKKSGLKKYFVIDDSEHSSLVSDSESQESSQFRRQYCYAERRAIVEYIIKRKLFPLIKGNVIWKQMEEERICARSWQSMKSHFLKYICQHLETFSLKEEDRNCFLKCMERTPTKSSSGSPAGQRGWRKNCKFYTFVEDTKILYYILEKRRYELTHGNEIWKKLEHNSIVAGRSWHSLKSRYKKFLAKYVERFAPNNKHDLNLCQKRLDRVKKSVILHNFLFDNLLDIAVSVNAIPTSNRSVKELKHLGLDCTFSIPFPIKNPSVCEKKNLDQCVSKIVQQFSKKIHMLAILSSNGFKDGENITNFLPSKYSSMLYLNITNSPHSISKIGNINGNNRMSVKSVKHVDDFTHCPSIVLETEGKIFECPELSLEAPNSFETLGHNGTIRCEDKHNKLSQCEETHSLYTSDEIDKDKSILNAATENVLKENEECLDVNIDELFIEQTQSTSSPNSETFSCIDVVNLTPESCKGTSEQKKIVPNDSGCSKLFDIPYPNDDRYDKLYSSLLECIEGIRENTLRQINEDDSCSVLEYYMSTQRESSNELTKSASKDNSTSMLESEEEEEQELRLRWGSEDSDSEI